MRALRRKFSQIKNAATAAPLAYRPGHYYSPICDPLEIRMTFRIEDGNDIPGIDLNRENQLARWQSWLQREKHPRWRRYDPNNTYYGIKDGICLYNFFSELKPARFIEIGSGHSSSCVIDTIESFGLSTKCTFIEPYPERLTDLLRRHTLIERRAQLVDLSLFDDLERGDILFIDSTHVLKTGSDVHYELFSILPRLRSGVFIHFHDIFFPFEYPHTWIFDHNMSWNEAYALRALLSSTNRYRIEFWNHYLTKTSDIDFDYGASLWISVL